MSIFAVSDLHLSLGVDKPMDKFRGWENYVERLERNWQRCVGENDTVVIPGDFSWGMKIEETLPDFRFLDGLNGKKILFKGNHDLWWSTANKMDGFFAENGIKSVTLLHNKIYETEEYCVCGTRGWAADGGENRKILAREALRLEYALSLADGTGKKRLVFLHYPPVCGNTVCEEIFSVIKKHNVDTVYYGHIHNTGRNLPPGEYEGVALRLVSADFLNFTPLCIAR